MKKYVSFNLSSQGKNFDLIPAFPHFYPKFPIFPKISRKGAGAILLADYPVLSAAQCYTKKQ